MTPPDIVEQLKKMAGLFTQFGNEEPSKFLLYVVDEIRRQQADIDKLLSEREGWLQEVETWRDAYAAERQDHEATMKAWDEERSGL